MLIALRQRQRGRPLNASTNRQTLAFLAGSRACRPKLKGSSCSHEQEFGNEVTAESVPKQEPEFGNQINESQSWLLPIKRINPMNQIIVRVGV